MLEDKKCIEMVIGKLEIYQDSLAVITIENRDVITKSDVEDVVKACNNSITGNYILFSNRVTDYSINPVELYEVLGSEKRIKGAAIISYRDSTNKLYPVEDAISDELTHSELDLKLFYSLKEAFIWGRLKLKG